MTYHNVKWTVGFVFDDFVAIPGDERYVAFFTAVDCVLYTVYEDERGRIVWTKQYQNEEE